MNKENEEAPGITLLEFHKPDPTWSFIFETKWYHRVWCLVTNPIRYLLTGVIRY